MPTVYRSSDSSAPALNDAAGSLNDLLLACLVNGYGSVPGAGWSRPFVNGNVSAFRNSTIGTGAYFRIDDSIGASARIRAYSAMTDIDSGVDPAPTVAEKEDGAVMRKTAGSFDWVIVADELTCWIEIDQLNIFGFGDFDSFVAADAGRYFIAAGADNLGSGTSRGNTSITTPASQGTLSNTSTGRGCYVGLSADQTTSGIRFALPYLGRDDAGGDTGNNYGIGGHDAPMPNPEPNTSRQFFQDAIVAHDGFVRGKMRGLYLPLNNLFGYSNNIPGAPGLPSGSDLVIMSGKRPAFFGNHGAVAVETGLDW